MCISKVCGGWVLVACKILFAHTPLNISYIINSPEASEYDVVQDNYNNFS